MEFQWPCPRCGNGQRIRTQSKEEAEEAVGSLCAKCSEETGEARDRPQGFILQAVAGGAEAAREEGAGEEAEEAQDRNTVRPADRGKGKGARR